MGHSSTSGVNTGGKNLQFADVNTCQVQAHAGLDCTLALEAAAHEGEAAGPGAPNWRVKAGVGPRSLLVSTQD